MLVVAVRRVIIGYGPIRTEKWRWPQVILEPTLKGPKVLGPAAIELERLCSFASASTHLRNDTYIRSMESGIFLAWQFATHPHKNHVATQHCLLLVVALIVWCFHPYYSVWTTPMQCLCYTKNNIKYSDGNSIFSCLLFNFWRCTWNST